MNIKKHIPFIAILLIVIVFTGCTPMMDVRYDYNKEINFSKYKTFAMYKLDEKNRSISQLNQDRLIKAIKNEMKKKGFEETESSPDLLVNAVVILKEKRVVTANTDYYGYGYGGVYRPYAWDNNMSVTRYNTYDYIDGTLIIDVLDRSISKLIWQGTGNQQVDSQLDNPDQQIPVIVAKIMEHFPPEPAPPKK
jgi:hypothetical protein